jgi:rhodanese-related sulfurtransferase
MQQDLRRKQRQRTAEPINVPQPDQSDTDLVLVDTTWGKLQPLHPFPEVPTVGELEVLDLVAKGAVLVDTRVGDSRSGITLPGAIHLPHDQLADRRPELAVDQVNILFCNGPQCPQTPDGIRNLLDVGHPAASLAYYRGGLHDWITLGFPTVTV